MDAGPPATCKQVSGRRLGSAFEREWWIEVVNVIESPAEQRFEATIDGVSVGNLDYIFDGDIMITTHTIVSPDYEGRGVGSALALAALNKARAEDLRVIPQCSFVSAYITRHPEFADLIAA